MVERHRPGAELGGHAPHRDRLEALGVGDRERRRGDLLAGVARRRARPARGASRSRLAGHARVRRSLALTSSYSVLLRCVVRCTIPTYEVRISESVRGPSRRGPRQALRRPLGAARRRPRRPGRHASSACSATTAPARPPRSASSPRSRARPTGTRDGRRPRRRRRSPPRCAPRIGARRPGGHRRRAARRPAPTSRWSAASTTCRARGRAAARDELLERLGLDRRRRPPGARPSPAACAAGSTWPPAWSPRRRCCSSTSRPPGLDPQSRNDLWALLRELVARRRDAGAHHAVPGGGRPAGRRDRRARPRPRRRRRARRPS